MNRTLFCTDECTYTCMVSRERDVHR